MNIRLQFYRPFDRDPDVHCYGEPFDSVLDSLIGGNERWSSAKEIYQKMPEANLKDHDVHISLHEDGTVLNFIAQNINLIPEFIAAISALISAWTAVIAVRKNKNEEGGLISQKRGYLINIDGVELQVGDGVDSESLQNILIALAEYKKRDNQKA